MEFSKSTTYIPKSHYEKHMAVIEALPLKKQKQWKTQLKDQFGVKTRCLYTDGQIWNWCSGEHKWCKVLPHDSLETTCNYSDEDLLEILLHANVLNHTGNHYRTKTVKVPYHYDGVRG